MNKKKLKVTICSHDGKDYFGGPYEWVKRFGPALREAGVEVSFLFFSDHRSSLSSTYLDLKNKGFHCKLMRVHSFTQYHDNTEDRIRWLMKEIIKNPPDVLIANITLYGLYASKWLKKAGIPVIGVLHSDDPSHEYMYDEFVGGTEEYALSAVVGVSNLLSEKAARYNVHQLPITTISCGTPVGEKKAIYRKDPFKIVYAGKISDPQKSITETVYALIEVVKTIPDIQVELYGSGAEEKKIMEIIRREASGYDIVFKGLISSDAIQDVFATAQAFVLLSNYEGLPIALMEAMAVGLVPVCLNIESGIPDLIDNEVSGLLVDNRGKAFVEAIKKLHDDPALWNRLSAQAIQKIIGTHAMPVVTAEWISLMKEVKRNATKVTPLTMPDEIILPPVHPLLQLIDVRKVAWWKYLLKQPSRFVYHFVYKYQQSKQRS